MSARDRKAHHGATNLTARSEKGSIIRKDFYRSWTHKLISPDVHQPTSAAFDTEHVYPNTATWRPVPLVDRDFTTTNAASYLNPKDQKQIAEHHDVSEEELAQRRRVREDQIEAVEALCKTAKAHFGTTASMMKVVRRYTPFVLLLVLLTFLIHITTVQQEGRGQYITPRTQRVLEAQQDRPTHQQRRAEEDLRLCGSGPQGRDRHSGPAAEDREAGVSGQRPHREHVQN